MQLAMSLGFGAMLAKFDIANACWIIVVHLINHLLLGMWRKRELVADSALPFGLKSAPKLIMVLADAVLWIMGRHGVVHVILYLHVDDYSSWAHDSQVSVGISQD